MNFKWPLLFSRFPSKRNRRVRYLMTGAVIVSSFFAYVSYQIIRQSTLEKIEQSTLLEVQQGADRMDHWLSMHQTTIQTIANAPLSQSIDWNLVAPYLRAETKRISDFVFLGLSQADGLRYTTADNRLLDASDRLWFKRAIAGQPHIDDPFISRAIQQPIIAISAPIPDQAGRPIGVIHGGVKVDRITEMVNQLRYGRASYAFLLNSEGRAIVHPDQALMSTMEHQAPSLLTSKDLELAAIARQMVDHQTGINRIMHQGNVQYIAYLPLSSAEWSVALVIPHHEIEKQLRLLDLIALVILGLTGLMLVVLWQLHIFEQSQLEKSKASALLDERNRLAREIHDILAQAFTGISLQLEAAQGVLAKHPDKATLYIHRASDLARRGLSEARRSVQALRSQALESDTLPSALKTALHEISQGTNLQLHFQLKGTPINLPDDLQLNLLRIGQEAITNTVRHAQATRLNLTLHYQTHQVQLTLFDNGIGFDLDSLVTLNGFGLVGIRERADRFDGTVKLTSSAQHGTVVDVTLPL